MAITLQKAIQIARANKYAPKLASIIEYSDRFVFVCVGEDGEVWDISPMYIMKDTGEMGGFFPLIMMKNTLIAALKYRYRKLKKWIKN